MDEFKPEDELKPDPSDRRTGRSRQASDRDEPQINFDDVDLDGDDSRPARSRRVRDEESYAEDEDILDEEQQRRPRKRKKAVAAKPASRQYLMMGIGILVLLLLIIGIGSALKAPAPSSTNEQNSPAEKNIDLSGGNSSEQSAGAPEQVANAPSVPASENAPRDVTLPPIASTPSQASPAQTPEGQQRVELPGDLNQALSQPQEQSQVDNAVGSTLPTEPATVAPVRNGNANANAARSPSASNDTSGAATRPERKQMVIEPKPQAKAPAAKAESKPAAAPSAKVESKAAAAPAKRNETAQSTPAKAPAAPAQPKAATPAAPTASGAQSSGNVSALKSAPASNYTLQLSSSSNYNNLNAWAKKSNLKNFVVYQTTRNGQPWYVLVSGVYASKDEAKRAVSTLPADVQAKNPWAKPLRQVQADLK